MNRCDICHDIIAAGFGIWARHEDKGLVFVHDQPDCTNNVIALGAWDLLELDILSG